MTAGSIAGVLLVLAWSRVDGLAAFYALWAGIGLVMADRALRARLRRARQVVPRRRAAPAGADRAHARRRAGELHLPAALAGADRRPRLARRAGDPRAHPRRHHDPASTRSCCARRRSAQPETAAAPSTRPRDALRSAPFWLLSAAFFLATFTGIAMTVLAVPYLVERGYSAPFAAFAVGLIGFSQIPGRVLFAAARPRASPPAWATAGVFALIAAGIAAARRRPRHRRGDHRARRARHGQRHDHALARDADRRPLRRRRLRHHRRRRRLVHHRRPRRRPGRGRRLRRRRRLHDAALDARRPRRRGRGARLPRGARPGSARAEPAANSSRTPGATARTRARSRRTGSAIALANFPLRSASCCSTAAEPG